MKNKKLKLEEKQIFEIIIDLALDDKERKKYNKSFAEKKAIVLSILDSLKTNEIHLENIKGWEGYIQRTVTTRDDFDVKTFKKENPELHKRLTDQIKDLYQLVEDMNDEHTWDIRDNHDQFDYE